MKNKLVVMAALGCALFSLSAFSADGSIQSAQLDSIKEGQSPAEVAKVLGKPMIVQDSEGGVLGYTYAVSDSDADAPRAFISFDEKQKVSGTGMEHGNSESNGANE